MIQKIWERIRNHTAKTDTHLLSSSSLAPKVYVEGHGCSASFADTEIISGLVQNEGFRLVGEEEDADISVLVTCSVKTVTENRMLSRIRELSQNGMRKVVVAGCLPKAEPQKVLNIRGDFSLVGPNNLTSIVPAIEATLSGRQLVSLDSSKLVKLGLPRSRLNSVVGIIEIASGCLSNCTFCQVKLVKGKVFSYPEDRLVNEAESLLAQGAKELWLTSTDNAAYGRDSKTTLPSLVSRISSIPGNFKIRLGMMNPLFTKRDLRDLVDSLSPPKVFKFLHLPVQSGSDRVLKLMQRGYTVADFESMVETVRCKFPDLTLSTDIIVGFPTETEGEFEESVALLERVKPEVLNLSRFGARTGTKAAGMDEQIPAEISKRRSSSMTLLSKRIQKEKNQSWIGWRGKVLIDEMIKGAVLGRNYAYKPCVVQGGQGTSLGTEMEVEIVGATAATLRAIPAS